MKKTRLLIIALVCTVMLMGVGYAYWTDSIQFNGTATAGKLEVKWINAAPYYPRAFTPYDSQNVVSATVTHGDKITTYEIKNLCPGQTAAFDVKAQNTGTIPVKFAGAVVTASGDTKLLGKLLGEATIKILDTNGRVLPLPPCKDGSGSPGTTNDCAISDFQAALDNLLWNVQLKPGESLCFDPNESNDKCIRFTLPAAVTNADDVQEKTCRIDIKFNWKQFNE